MNAIDGTYAVRIKQNTKLADWLRGTRFWVGVDRNGRYIGGDHASSLEGAKRKAQAIVLADITNRAIGSWESEIDWKVKAA